MSSPSPPSRVCGSLRIVPVFGLLLLLGCGGSDGTGPDGLRFGQVGEVTLRIQTSLLLGAGTLVQELAWSSEGPYRLTESISYQGELGDQSEISFRQNPETLAGAYAIWITQVNETPGLRLFVEELDPSLQPECGIGRSRVTLAIRDDLRNESREWTRCATGSFGTIATATAGPDAAAARVAQAVILLRESTVGEGFVSDYQGSVPFATVDRGEESGTSLPEPLAITSPERWDDFWVRHAGPDAAVPEIDFSTDLVIVAGVGVRQEAGDSVEVRSVLPVDTRTFVRIVERIPGDFCSPVSRIHTPFHIVRAPRVPLPVEFIQLETELVPCGI